MASSKSVLQSLSEGSFPGYKNITTARLGKNTERENKRETNIKHNSENKGQRRKLTKNNPEQLKLVVRAEYIRNIIQATWKLFFFFINTKIQARYKNNFDMFAIAILVIGSCLKVNVSVPLTATRKEGSETRQYSSQKQKKLYRKLGRKLSHNEGGKRSFVDVDLKPLNSQ